MKQVFIVHGGSSYNSYESYLRDLENSTIDIDRLRFSPRWSQESIITALPDYDIFSPRMPNSSNAQYNEWKIYFDKIRPYFDGDTQLVGHSLGAMFLAIYLNQMPLSVPLKRLILLAGAYDDDSNEELGSFKVHTAENLVKCANEIHLFHSKDDPVVPFSELAKFQHDIPSATSHIFENKGHFMQSDFPELYAVLKK